MRAGARSLSVAKQPDIDREIWRSRGTMPALLLNRTTAARRIFDKPGEFIVSRIEHKSVLAYSIIAVSLIDQM